MALALPLLLLGAPVRAALAADASFVQAVDTALALVRQGQRGDFAAVGQAQRLVAQIVPQDQALAGDLTLRPYKLDDAATRLQALGAALRAPGPSPHPGADQLLAQQYDQSGSPSQGAQPSPVAAALDWIARQIADFIIHTPLVAFLGLALLIAALVVVGILIVRAAGSGGGGGDQEEAEGGAARRRRGARAGDHFAAADRLAAGGQLAAALRELAAGVAGALGGPETWDASSLTVAELFSRADQPDRLRPLLLPFERWRYGDHSPDGEAYAAAAEAARPFRVAS